MYFKPYLTIIYAALLLLSSCTGITSELEIHCREGHQEETIQQLQQASYPIYIPNGSFNPGYTHAYWWLKTTISNDTNEPFLKYILLNNPQINHITVIDPAVKNRLTLSDKKPFNERPVYYSDFAIPVQLNPYEQKTLYIGIDKSGESLQLKAELAGVDGLMKLGNFKMLAAGLTIGWMILIIFIVLLIWSFSKEIANIHYSMYIVCITLWILSNLGIGFQMVWPNSPMFHNFSKAFFILLAQFFFAKSILHYFSSNAGNRILHKLLNVESGMALCMLALMVSINLDQLPSILKLGFLIVLSILVGSFVILCSLYIYVNWKAAVRYSSFYFFGMLFFLLMAICQIFFQFGLTGTMLEFINLYGASTSLLIETSIIASGFIYKFNESEKEKKTIRSELLAQQYALSNEIINIQEMERERIGRDIHDSIGGLLATLKLYLEKSTMESNGNYLEKSLKILNHSIKEIRIIIDNLVPQNIHLHGFSKAFELIVTNHNEAGKAKIMLYHHIPPGLSISSQTVLYRILSELLNNCEKHAHASEINISIIEDQKEIHILFEDNGKGFDPDKIIKGHGLKNIFNRVKFLQGRIHIDSNDHGTTFIIRIPLEYHRIQIASHEKINNTR
jgi:signal transduction histidine kinase